MIATVNTDSRGGDESLVTSPLRVTLLAGSVLVKGPSWWRQLTDGYVEQRRREDRSPRTIRALCWALSDVGELLDERGSSELGRDDIVAWSNRLYSSDWRAGSKAAAVAHLRGFIQWATDESLIAPGLARVLPRFKVPNRLPRPIPKEDLEVLQRRFAAPARRTGGLVEWLDELRARALFWFLYSTGVRISEALQVTRESYVGQSAAVIAKGGYAHQAFSTMQARRAVDDYLAARVDRRPEVFVRHHADGSAQPATPEILNYAWHRIAGELGIRHFTNHNLRHSCGTVIYDRTRDVLAVARHLGHRSVQTTQGYVEVSDRWRLEVVQALEGDTPPPPRPRLLPSLNPRRRG